MSASVVVVDFPQLLAKAVHFHADHGILRGDEVRRRPAKHLGGDVELGELLFLVLEVLRADVFQEPRMASASAEKLDSPVQLLPLSIL